MSEDVIEHLVKLLSKLPGIGRRSARRAVLHMVKNRETIMHPLSQSLTRAIDTIQVCHECGNVDSQSPCNICINPKRDTSLLCIVEDVSDLWAIERSNIFQGFYHVLGGTLSAIDGRGPEELHIPRLINRIATANFDEVILALNATVEGQMTAHYITERLQGEEKNELKISQLAHGIPMGGELNYLDDGTLQAALQSRVLF